MLGTIDLVLDSTSLAVGAAVLLAAVTVGAVVWSRDRSTTAAICVTGTIATGLVYLWFVVLSDAWVPPWASLLSQGVALIAAILGFVVAAACVALPLATLRRGLVAPLVPLAAAVGLLTFALLWFDGEPDPIVIYSVALFPVVLCAEFLLAVVETVGRGLWRAVDAG